MINTDIQRFFKRNNININQISINVDCRVYSEREVNEISAQCGVRQKQTLTEVGIADIVGYREGRANIFLTMSEFFDSTGEVYQTRSLGMLEYSTDEIMMRLGDSFEREPIIVDDIGGGKYVVSANGLHRYTILRAHYLNELEKCQGNKQKELRLKEKYFIPVKVNELDHIKTYSKFLLKKYDKDIIRIMSDWDENYRYTGKMDIRYSDGRNRILGDRELIDLVRKTMSQVPQQQAFRDLGRYFKNAEFKQFVEQYLGEIIDVSQFKENGGEEHD